MTENREITAIFVRKTQPLQVRLAGDGTVRIVSAQSGADGHTTSDTASVRFIHPYWLKVIKQAADGSHVVIGAFARPGAVFDVRVNAKIVARKRVGKSFWVRIPLPSARPGDIVELDGIGNHRFSHAISLGRTPDSEIVH